MKVYILLLFSFLLSIFLLILFLYLTIQKIIDNLFEKKKLKYRKKIQPQLSLNISKGNMYTQRLFQPKEKWKRAIIIDFLINKATTIKNKDEIYRIKQISNELGLTEDLAEKLIDIKWWTAADATRKVGILKLNELSPLILKNLNSEEYDLWTASARALSKMNKTSYLIKFLIEKENSLKNPSIIRIGDMLIQSNEEDGDKDIDLMLENINNVSFLLKGIFIEALAKRKAVIALPYIEQFLESDEMEYRLKALKAIGDIGLTSREEDIIKFLSSNNWIEKVMAIRIIQVCSIRRAIPDLIDLLSDKNWWTRLRSAEALRGFGPVGIEKLKWIIEFHTDAYARDMAAKVLQEGEFEVMLS